MKKENKNLKQLEFDFMKEPKENNNYDIYSKINWCDFSQLTTVTTTTVLYYTNSTAYTYV